MTENSQTEQSESPEDRAEDRFANMKPLELNRHLTQVLQLKESDAEEFERQFLSVRSEFRRRNLDLPDHALEDSIAIDARNDEGWDGRSPKQMSPEETRRIHDQMEINKMKFGKLFGGLLLGALIAIAYGLIRGRDPEIILPIALTILILGGIYLYQTSIGLFRKDLKNGQKIKTEVEVYRIETVSEKDRRDLGFEEDRILHFMSNKHKVKKLYFNSSKRPELVNAKKVKVVQSRYAKVPFYYEKVE